MNRKVIAKLREIERLEIVVLLLGFLLMYFPLGEGNPVRAFLANIGLWSVLGVTVYHFHRIRREAKKQGIEVFI